MMVRRVVRNALALHPRTRTIRKHGHHTKQPGRIHICVDPDMKHILRRWRGCNRKGEMQCHPKPDT